MARNTGLTFVNAQVITDAGPVAGTLRLQHDRIDAVNVAPAAGDLVVDVEHGIILPGLVNAHDHLDLNSFRRLKWRERYENARDWIADFQPRFATDPGLAAARAETRDDRLWVGGLKNLLCGATTVCHHDPLYAALQARFPVRVVKRFRMSHSLGVDGPRVAVECRRTPRAWPWILHAAEGVDPLAAAEIETLDSLGCLRRNTVIVHGVGAGPDERRRLLDRGVSLIWCPTSNAFLFDATADVRAFDDCGRLAIGSDSRLSGEGDLLDEMRAARATCQVSAEGVVRAVTAGAADVLRLDSAGRLRPGAPADLVVLRPVDIDVYESVAQATRADVRLVMIGGRALFAEPALGAAAACSDDGLVDVRVDGAPGLLARWIAARATTMLFTEPGLEVLAC